MYKYLKYKQKYLKLQYMIGRNIEERQNHEFKYELIKYVTPCVLNRLINSELYIVPICDKK